MTWTDELLAMLTESRGDLGVFAALVALRRTEAGGPGKEFGVLSKYAPTYAQQLHSAAISLRNSEERQRLVHTVVRLPGGWFTDDFYDAFSARWAPLRAPNDPTGLNIHHANNMKMIAQQVSRFLLDAIGKLPGGLLER